MNWSVLKPPYSFSTIAGISLLSGLASALILGQIDWRTALAGAVSGTAAILIKQSAGVGAVIMPNSGPNTIQADTVEMTAPKPPTSTPTPPTA